MTSLIVLKLVGNRGTVRFNFGSQDGGCLKIVRYQAIGLTGNSPIFVSFAGSGLPTSAVMGGSNNPALSVTSTEFPLPVIVTPTGDSAWEFHSPIVVMDGDNLMTETREWNYYINDFNGNPLDISNLLLILEFAPRSRYNSVPGKREIEEFVRKQMISQTQFFHPDQGFSKGVPHGGYWNA
jgi:hypothetical protein